MQVNPSSSLPLPRRILDVDSRDIHELRSLLEPTSQAHSILDQIAADEALDVNDVCLPPTFPTSVQQCLTTYVPPMFNLPDNDPSSSSVPAPRSLTSTNLGRVFMNTPDQAITVRDSPQLKAILEATVTSAFTSDPTRGRSRLRAWRRTYTSAWEIMPTAAIPYEDDQSGASLLYLATPVNDLLGDLTSYTDESSPPHPPPKWSRPSPKHRIGVTDWVCHSGTTSVGVVEWERQNVLTDSDIGSFATFARQYGVRNAFQVKVSGGAPISHPRGLLPNASKALLQIWAECHHYRARWGLLYNTQWFCIVYLASTFELLISDGFPPVVGLNSESLTIAAALAAIALCPQGPDNTDSNDDIKFLRLPLEAPLPPVPSAPYTPPRPTTRSTTGAALSAPPPPPSAPTSFRRTHATKIDSAEAMVEPGATSDSMCRLVIGQPMPGGQGRVWTTYAAELHGPSNAETLVVQWASSHWAKSMEVTVPPPAPGKDISSSVNTSPARSSITSPARSSVLSSEHNTSSPLSTAPSTEVRDIIVKLCDPAQIHLDVEEDRQTIVDCIMNEANLFDGPLRQLQGVVVPEYYGLYEGVKNDATGTGPVYLAVMESAGKALANKWSDIRGVTRMKVSRAYRQLHAAGIWHGDIEARHVRCNGDKILIIDFDQSRIGSLALLDDEQDWVDRLLLLR